MTMEAPIKAIETLYAGRRFRSRLEARWAVFFDRAHVAWDYEVQGYETSVRRYLPDFELTGVSPGPQVLVEVKGRSEDLDLELMTAVVQELKRPLLILGPLPKWTKCGYVHSLLTHGERLGRREVAWVRVDHEGHPGYLWQIGPVQVGLPSTSDILGRDEPLVNTPRDIRQAYEAASKARFEHGEAIIPPGLDLPRDHPWWS